MDMAHGTQEERVSVAQSSAAGLWALTVLFGVAAVLVELLGVVIVWLTSVDSAGSTYLEGLATIGVVSGLFLGGAAILALAARKGRRPTAGVMVGVAVASLLATQAVLIVTGELGEDAGVRQDVAEAASRSAAEMDLPLELR